MEVAAGVVIAAPRALKDAAGELIETPALEPAVVAPVAL